jgi:pimeloyl-ACP methyl ester carboxylesterase
MSEDMFRDKSVLCMDPHGFHRVRYTEWGDPDNPRVLVCVHGLTRNARDFDFLAAKMSDRYRVLCPDVVGRGRSSWLNDKKDYGYPVYLNDMITLLAKSGVEQVDWVGTSMGGLIGMILAAIPDSPVKKIVINDVGSFIPKAAIARLCEYVGTQPEFDALEALEERMRSVSPFGELSAEQWRHLTLHSARQDDDGKWRFRYDPGIAVNFKAQPPADVDMRLYWNALRIPALVIRGDSSDLLLAETLEEMKRRPGTQAHVVANTGHAPTLMDDGQADPIRAFLLG